MIKKWVWYILRKMRLAGIIQLVLKSGLTEDGWFRSFHAQQSIDAQGNPLPWFCYTFIKFLAPRLQSDMQLFEYGSGNSTLWFAGKVKSIKAVEHDEKWVQKLQPMLPANATIIFRSLETKEHYVQEVAKEGILYDLIIVDGRRRNDCVEAALPCLKPHGVLLLDNSERTDYLPARNLLKAQGFKAIDFWGMPVGAAHYSCTTVIYKNDNILGI